MRDLINKFFKKEKKINQFFSQFQKLRQNTDVEKIFRSISVFSNNSEVRYVGGCVRKILNKEKVDDIDLAANINPIEVSQSLKENGINYYETGIEHGTLTATIKDQNFEITSLRKDISTDGRHAKVEFSESWYEDASRRDFTINSIYADLDGNLYDPFNGKKDLENGVIKFIGDPEKRIREDYLRILRYIRFFLNYSRKKHDAKVIKIIKQNLSGLSKISSERLLDELKKLVLSKGFLKLFKDDFCLEIIGLIFPQLKNLSLFKNLNKYALENIFSQDFIFLISLMIIDETDNAEYFLYKFNISNEEKKRIKFLKDIFSKTPDKKIFEEKNLWKILYFNNNSLLNDLINFQIFKSKKEDKKLIKLKEFFSSQVPPKFNVKATYLMEKFNLKEGKELGDKLKQIETTWINNSFKISEDQIEKIIKN